MEGLGDMHGESFETPRAGQPAEDGGDAFAIGEEGTPNVTPLTVGGELSDSPKTYAEDEAFAIVEDGPEEPLTPDEVAAVAALRGAETTLASYDTAEEERDTPWFNEPTVTTSATTARLYREQHLPPNPTLNELKPVVLSMMSSDPLKVINAVEMTLGRKIEYGEEERVALGLLYMAADNPEEAWRLLTAMRAYDQTLRKADQVRDAAGQIEQTATERPDGYPGTM